MSKPEPPFTHLQHHRVRRGRRTMSRRKPRSHQTRSDDNGAIVCPPPPHEMVRGGEIRTPVIFIAFVGTLNNSYLYQGRRDVGSGE